ncbi:helix-turn-helix transcriptional regulator [Glycomyces luteolus]|uniref:Helix-turn-helix transcriptional regulator n=1 Tax=Glycomyces luteolus TaxID=2670330 RepID=A0A9X3PCT4_9ACTN|nr:helix-turn-helix transcriptional regulator [Glycomyces luteolus]MDA1362722.1 helix-turn-helix transcriptional regulator [Glycomyces luteolus]
MKFTTPNPSVVSSAQLSELSTVKVVRQSVERLALLSKRQREVLKLIAGGATNAQISNRLGIASPTVENHVKDLKYRLGVDSRCLLAVVGYFEVLRAVPGSPMNFNTPEFLDGRDNANTAESEVVAAIVDSEVGSEMALFVDR